METKDDNEDPDKDEQFHSADDQSTGVIGENDHVEIAKTFIFQCPDENENDYYFMSDRRGKGHMVGRKATGVLVVGGKHRYNYSGVTRDDHKWTMTCPEAACKAKALVRKSKNYSFTWTVALKPTITRLMKPR